MSLPFVTAICPTYRHPELLANSLALWLAQDYPIDRRELVILDDGQTFTSQSAEGFVLWSEGFRRPSLPDKYNTLLALMPAETEIVFVWEDDDIYLPGYIQWHVAALASAEFSKPSTVLSDYTGRIAPEPAAGRFHASMAFRADLIRRIGGWPETNRADFDQQLISRLMASDKGVADPCQDRSTPIQYVYSWRTGAAHCQSTMRSPDDETWYQRAPEAYAPVPFVGQLAPQYDDRTRRILAQLGVGVEAAA